MFQEKQSVLSEAQNILNRAERSWEVVIEDDTILAHFKWWEEGFFEPKRINNQLKNYTFRARLDDRGKWHELDAMHSSGEYAGNVRQGRRKEFFAGKTFQKSVTFDLKTGEKAEGFYDLDTNEIKNSIRSYLSSCGWKKAGIFG